jgi:Cu/Zn superoxide dismutase
MRVRLIVSAAIFAAVGGFIACNDSTAPASTTFLATLNGANEKPTAVTTPAVGTATYTLTGNTLTYTITVTGLTSNTTMSHIHVGSSAVAGPIVVPYTVYAIQNGLVSTGTIDLTHPVASGANTITGDSLKVLLNNGNAYTNVHTSNFPGGEIRGQIIRQ